MEEKCVHCGCVFTHGISAHMIVICPGCRKYTSAICDYGFGPITPCDIYWGDIIVGTITGHCDGEYKLVSDHFGFTADLAGGYKNLEIYHEASKIISEKLNENGE